MELIATIGKAENTNYRTRKASIAVVANDNNEIAIMNVGKYEYHKLPGGRIEKDEDKEEALKREILEEVGAEIDIKTEIGEVIEYRNDFNLIHISYAYLCRVIGDIKPAKYTVKEQKQKYSLKWMSIDEAIEELSLDNNKHLGNSDDEKVALYIIKRDYEILKKYKETLEVKDQDVVRL